MTDKSHVSMEQHQCPVCLNVFDTGAILLDKRLKQSMKQHTVTGWGICPEHQAALDNGYHILVGVVPPTNPKATLTAATANRTGNIVLIRKGVAVQLFEDLPSVSFCDEAVFHMLQDMVKEGAIPDEVPDPGSPILH